MLKLFISQIILISLIALKIPSNNGNDDYVKKFGKHVALIQAHESKRVCIGMIIHCNAIVTTARCLVCTEKNMLRIHDPRHLKIYVGTTNRVTFSPNTQRAFAAKLLVHPYYKHETMEKNVGLILLNQSLRMDRLHVSPVKISRKPIVLDSVCITMGWGSQSGKQTIPEQLFSSEVRLVSIVYCKQRLMDQDTALMGIVCGIGISPLDHVCAEDPGSPLICGGELQAINSFSMACGTQSYSGLYLDLQKFKKWLRDPDWYYLIHSKAANSKFLGVPYTLIMFASWIFFFFDLKLISSRLSCCLLLI